MAVVFTGTSADVLNAIRNDASTNFRNFVPFVQDNAEAVKAVGKIIMQMPELQNEFLNRLVNRIGRVIVTNKVYENPWAVFKKESMGYGATEEEIFIDLAKPFTYDPATAEGAVFARQLPDVRAAFHTVNFKTFYKTTVSEDDLRAAFTSADGVRDLITRITDNMITSANYDEFNVMKYMLAKAIIGGKLHPISVASASTGETLLKEYATAFKTASNAMEFMNDTYNPAGVHNFALKDDQYLIMDSATNARMDVNVLASAFNMGKAEFLGHLITVDSFGTMDGTRLGYLFNGDAWYSALTSAEITALNTIPGVIVDRDFFRVFDIMNNFTNVYNAQGLYWNQFDHVWKTFSISPFANAAVFVPTAPSITSVDLSPATVTVKKGQTAVFTPTVVTAGFAPSAVNYTITGTNLTNKTYINGQGVLHVDANETASSITVTATSVFDSTKTDTATVTVSA